MTDAFRLFWQNGNALTMCRFLIKGHAAIPEDNQITLDYKAYANQCDKIKQ